MDVKGLALIETLSKRFNNSLFPRCIRGLIVGKSASGKTILLLNFLLRPRWLDYNSLYVFGISLFQLNIVFSKRLSRNNFQRKLLLVCSIIKLKNEFEYFTNKPTRRNGQKPNKQVRYRMQVL